jgi:hypothetical protein
MLLFRGVGHLLFTTQFNFCFQGSAVNSAYKFEGSILVMCVVVQVLEAVAAAVLHVRLGVRQQCSVLRATVPTDLTALVKGTYEREF